MYIVEQNMNASKISNQKIVLLSGKKTFLGQEGGLNLSFYVKRVDTRRNQTYIKQKTPCVVETPFSGGGGAKNTKTHIA